MDSHKSKSIKMCAKKWFKGDEWFSKPYLLRQIIPKSRNPDSKSMFKSHLLEDKAVNWLILASICTCVGWDKIQMRFGDFFMTIYEKALLLTFAFAETFWTAFDYFCSYLYLKINPNLSRHFTSLWALLQLN